MGALPGAPSRSRWIGWKCAVTSVPGGVAGTPAASLACLLQQLAEPVGDRPAVVDGRRWRAAGPTAAGGSTSDVLSATAFSRPRTGEVGPARMPSASTVCCTVENGTISRSSSTAFHAAM